MGYLVQKRTAKRSILDDVQWAVIVAMVPMRMMEMTIDQVVNVITVWNSFVSATFSMDMGLIVPATLVFRCTAIGIFLCNLDYVFVHMVPMGMI